MKNLFLGLLFGISLWSNAQNIQKEVLFTVDDKPYYTDEFVRVYNKNLDLVKDESQKDLDKYLQLYVGYKLKVNKAIKLGLDKSPQYQNELKNYRTQLSKAYTTDSKVTDALVNEAYARLQKEVSASHILIMLDENALPQDTLAAYNKIMEVRKKALAGEDFGKLAQEFSQDPSAKDNKGNLGYFTAFKMVYPFENATYNTAVGSVSMPVRTRFGFHLVKVNDIRANTGDIQVAHIMIMKPKDSIDDGKAKNKIDDIYKKLQQGESFEELAKQFSEDKSSASKGGVLNKFGSGQISSPEFEAAAFALTKEHPISAPIQSQFGWHILKLIEKFPVKSLEESKSEIENKISKDERSRKISNSLTEKLKNKYQVKNFPKEYLVAEKAINDSVYQEKWKLPKDLKPFNGTLFSYDKKNVPTSDFLAYVEKSQKGNKPKPMKKLVSTYYNNFIDESLNQHYNDNLENEFPEFAAVMNEYRDGLLLFDLMDKEIWQKSKTDTLGLQSYYENHKNNYQWKTRAQAIILSSIDKEVVKKALNLLKKGKIQQEIKDALNTKDVVNIMINDGTYEEGAEALPKETKMEEGVSDIMKHGNYYFATKINKILPAGNKTFDESKGKVINEYQQYLEQNWVDELKKEFTVKINNDVFEKVKAKIKNK